MADHDFTTGGDEDYLPHVLYIKPGDPNCEAVISKINQLSLYPHVLVHDATKTKPGWLRGVPTMLTKATESAAAIVTERVPNILARLNEIRGSELGSTGVSNMAAVGASAIGGESLYAEGVFSIEGDNAPGPAAPDIGSRGPQNEKSKRRAEMEASTNSAVENLMNSRAQFDQRMQRNNPGGAPQRQMEQRQPAQPMQRRSAW